MIDNILKMFFITHDEEAWTLDNN